MTNFEKAKEISQDFYMPDTGFNREDLYDSAIEMAQWKDDQFAEEKRQWIEKTCEWLKDNVNEYLDWYDWEECRVDKDELLYDFKKAMEGGEE